MEGRLCRGPHRHKWKSQLSDNTTFDATSRAPYRWLDQEHCHAHGKPWRTEAQRSHQHSLRHLFTPAGGLIMSASHNPGGPKEDWGIKFNYSAGEPAPERITDKIFQFTQSIKELKMADLPDIDLSKLGKQSFGDFEVRSQAIV